MAFTQYPLLGRTDCIPCDGFRFAVGPAHERLAAELRERGALSNRMECGAAFAQKRAPVYRGWHGPEDCYRLPLLEELREGATFACSELAGLSRIDASGRRLADLNKED